MSPKPDISKTFSYPVFGYHLKVTITEKVGTLARKLYPDLPAHQTSGIVEAIHVVRDNRSTAHIILPYNAGINCIVHECSHFVWWLMDQVGAQQENEIVAYHLGYTVERVCEWIGKVDPLDPPVDKVVEDAEKIALDKMANL